MVLKSFREELRKAKFKQVCLTRDQLLVLDLVLGGEGRPKRIVEPSEELWTVFPQEVMWAYAVTHGYSSRNLG